MAWRSGIYPSPVAGRNLYTTWWNLENEVSLVICEDPRNPDCGHVLSFEVWWNESEVLAFYRKNGCFSAKSYENASDAHKIKERPMNKEEVYAFLDAFYLLLEDFPLHLKHGVLADLEDLHRCCRHSANLYRTG
jgi:hypothetical protein